MAHEKRKIAAILAADVVGYSRLIEFDEPGTFQRLRAVRNEVFEPHINAWHGRLFKEVGDCFLVEFGSVVDAVLCALALQRQLIAFNSDTLKDRCVEFRMAINLCDVIIDGDDLKGDGINVAARLQERADPGGIVVSSTANDHLQGKIEVRTQDIGEQQVKNISRPIRAYRIQFESAPAAGKSSPSPSDLIPVSSGKKALRASWFIRGSILAGVIAFSAFAAWVQWPQLDQIPIGDPIPLSIARVVRENGLIKRWHRLIPLLGLTRHSSLMLGRYLLN